MLVISFNKSVVQTRYLAFQRLVLTSSASVVYDGTDIKNGSEDMPYSSRPMDYYIQTKILQEQVSVLMHFR